MTHNNTNRGGNMQQHVKTNRGVNRQQCKQGQQMTMQTGTINDNMKGWDSKWGATDNLNRNDRQQHELEGMTRNNTDGGMTGDGVNRRG